jgi:hypothetical protein
MKVAGSTMTLWLRRSVVGFPLAAVFAMAGLPAQQTGAAREGADQSGDVRLPNGKLQLDEILKEEHEQNIKDAARLTELAQQLQQDLEKYDYTVLSMSTLKKTEDIEKLARKIRIRLRHD